MYESTASRGAKDWALDALSFFARFFMAFIWIAAGWAKIQDRIGTIQSIQGYDIFSDTWARWIAIIIGPVEIAGGVLLLLGIFLRQAGKVSTAVLLAFIVGIIQAWVRGLNIDCGCFGAGNPEDFGMDYFTTILRDLGFVLLSMVIVWRPFNRWAIYA